MSLCIWSPVLLQRLSACLRSCFAFFCSKENHGDCEWSVIHFVLSGACLSTTVEHILSKTSAVTGDLTFRIFCREALRSILKFEMLIDLRFLRVTSFFLDVSLKIFSSQQTKLWSLMRL